eukprot:g8695.t1
MINDDYCDCRDGTDETRTPACSHVGQSRFFCANTGALKQTVPTSRVWDGVCDCCDGSDEIVGLGRYDRWNDRWPAGAGSLASRAGAGAETAAACDRNGCERLLEEARAKAIDAYRSVQAGLVAREVAEAESKQAVARWEATLRMGEVDDGVRKEELKAVEKLEVLLKVYLQDEERIEQRERIQLAKGGRCSSNANANAWRGEGEKKNHGAAGATGGRPAAAALGPCEDKSAESEAAARVRAARAAARAQLDAKEEEEQQRGRGKAGRNKKRRGKDGAGPRETRKSVRSSPGGGGGVGGATTADDILELQWPVDVVGADNNVNRSSNDDSKGRGAAGEGGGPGVAGGGSEEGTSSNRGGRAGGAGGVHALSLKTYVKQRQAGGGGGGGGAALTEEKKAEELRKTALLGPVLNDGERGVYLGLTILLRMAGLPLLAPLRGLMVLCAAARDQAARLAASLAADYLSLSSSAGTQSSPSSHASWMARVVVGALERYRDRGLPGISPHLDYRRYPTLRSVVLRWDEFLDGKGKFLMVMWDAPVALWDFFLPPRDDEHERPEAAMLREGIARAKAILREAKADDAAAAAGGKGAGGRAQRRREEKEAKRLLGLDLGQHSRFAALAEKCLELQEAGYLYRLCPFKEAKQDRNSLGRWRGWQRAEPGGRQAAMMLFDGGSRCHNGELRSCEVLVECGSEDALTAAEELEIGLYSLTLETPLACTEAALREAEERLEAFGAGRAGLESNEGRVLPGIDSTGNGGVAAESVDREEL